MNGQVDEKSALSVSTRRKPTSQHAVQCYRPAAAAFTKNTIGSQRVRLVSDSLSTNRDRYDRVGVCVLA